MISEKVWSKIYAVVAFLIVNFILIDRVFTIVCPHLLGSQIDKEYIKSINTETITNGYDKFDYYYEDKDGIVCISERDRTNKRNVDIEIYIHKDNVFSSKTYRETYWYGNNSLFSPNFDTVNVIEKDNIQIIVTEFTRTPRSKKAQAYLEEVLAQFAT